MASSFVPWAREEERSSRRTRELTCRVGWGASILPKARGSKGSNWFAHYLFSGSGWTMNYSPDAAGYLPNNDLFARCRGIYGRVARLHCWSPAP